MPGVLQLEAIAQVAGILMLRQVEHLGQLAYFMAADDVKWRKAACWTRSRSCRSFRIVILS